MNTSIISAETSHFFEFFRIGLKLLTFVYATATILMLARASPLLRSLPQSSSFPMARLVARAAASFPVNLSTDIVSFRLAADLVSLRRTNRLSVSSLFGRRFHALCREDGKLLRRVGTVFASQREYRKARRRPVRSKERELELSVSIGIEDDLPDDPELLVYLALSMIMRTILQ